MSQAGRTLVKFETFSGLEVLDVCCGTGMVALDAAQAVGASGRVVGLDITQRMLDKVAHFYL